MLAIFTFTNGLLILKSILQGKYKWSKIHLFAIGLVVSVMFLTKEVINVAIVERTTNILTGGDSSAYNRLIESWLWVDRERIWFGNLIGHTPPITNVFAYVLSDFGFFGLIPYLLFTFSMAISNFTVFVFFVGMNIAKGGYLNPAYWLMLTYIFLYFLKYNIKEK